MKLVIDQVAIAPADPVAAKRLLSEMGATEWCSDHVKAEGRVFGRKTVNESDSLFTRGIMSANEFEVLNYIEGSNWVEDGVGRGKGTVSHLGAHCSSADLAAWRKFFEVRGIRVAQEVLTESHTNKAIAGKRRYNYVIFDTKSILGVDLKFIVRHVLIVVECLVCQSRETTIEDTSTDTNTVTPATRAPITTWWSG